MRIQRVDILLALACTIVFACVTLAVKGTRAQEQAEQPHHHQFHDFYKEWKKPDGSGGSCCNARFDQYGVERGDCEAAPFELKKTDNGLQWFAYVPMLKRIVPIPDAKIIREKNPDPTGRDGHVCTNRFTGELLCAVPPTGSL